MRWGFRRSDGRFPFHDRVPKYILECTADALRMYSVVGTVNVAMSPLAGNPQANRLLPCPCRQAISEEDNGS